MKRARPVVPLLAIFCGLLAAGLPSVAFAATATFFGPLVPDACNCPGLAAGFGCVLQVLQNGINMGITFACVIATAAIVWGGFSFIASAGNPESRTKGVKLIMGAFIGLVIVLAAWIMVDYVMKTFYNGGSQFGPWNTILAAPSASQCVAIAQTQPIFNGNILVTPGSPQTYGNPGSGDPGSGGDIATRICNAANAAHAIPMSTASAPDTQGGKYACAWAVGQVVQQAGLAGFSSSVSELEGQLKGGRGTSEAQSAAVCGDIVVAAGTHHVGICLNAGCTQVISNSSSKASFSWVSGPDFAPSYHDGVGRFYRVTN